MSLDERRFPTSVPDLLAFPKPDCPNIYGGAYSAKAVLASITDDRTQRKADPLRQCVEAFAAKSGWTPDDGECAFEFVQRASYEQGLKDALSQAVPEAVDDCPNYVNCQGQCFVCEHFEGETLAYPNQTAPQSVQQPQVAPYGQAALELCDVCGGKTLISGDCCLNCERDQLPAAHKPDGWELTDAQGNIEVFSFDPNSDPAWVGHGFHAPVVIVPLYKKPLQPLTDAQKETLWGAAVQLRMAAKSLFLDGVAAAEAAHRIVKKLT